MDTIRTSNNAFQDYPLVSLYCETLIKKIADKKKVGYCFFVSLNLTLEQMNQANADLTSSYL